MKYSLNSLYIAYIAILIGIFIYISRPRRAQQTQEIQEKYFQKKNNLEKKIWKNMKKKIHIFQYKNIPLIWKKVVKM